MKSCSEIIEECIVTQITQKHIFIECAAAFYYGDKLSVKATHIHLYLLILHIVTVTYTDNNRALHSCANIILHICKADGLHRYNPQNKTMQAGVEL